MRHQTHSRRLKRVPFGRGSVRRSMVLGLLAASVAAVGAFAAHEIAAARQKPVVVLRFLAGYFDRNNRFVPTAGRGATNVDRNAVLMFVCSGGLNLGPNIQATLPLTLSEQAELDALTVVVRTNEPAPPTAAQLRRFRELGGDVGAAFEPGVLARRRSLDFSSRVVATGSVSQESVKIASLSSGGQSQAEGAFFKVRKRRRRRYARGRFTFNPRFVVATFNRPGEIEHPSRPP